MNQAEHDQRQRNLEQNVYASATTAEKQLAKLTSIETALQRIFWILVVCAVVGLGSLVNR